MCRVTLMFKWFIFTSLFTKYLRYHLCSDWSRGVFLVENLTSLLYLPIPLLAETRKIFRDMLCQFVFRLSWHFKQEKSVFWKASFLQNKNWLREQDFMYKTSRLVRISLLIIFITKKKVIKAIKNFFPVFCILTLEGLGKF